MVTRALAAATAALLLAGCDQFTSVQGTPLPRLARPLVVMHRGAGAGNPVLRENTMPAFVHGASLYDGAEMDLQLSKDGTIWLGHDNDVHGCGLPSADFRSGSVIGCFQDLTDGDIDAVAYCDTTATPCTSTPGGPGCTQRYVRLSEVFQTFTTDPTLTTKILALDVKDQLCHALDIPQTARDMAGALDGLVRAYGMDWRLVVESDQSTFMDEFHAKGTPEYLFVEGYAGADPIIADADRYGADGISYRYTNEPFDPTFPDGLRARGLRVMVWPVPDPQTAVSDIAPVWNMFPDVIATDREDFFEHVLLPRPL